MERIPRRALAGVAVLAFGLTLGLGPSGRTADGAAAARNRAISTAVADSVLKPVASTQALRPGAPVELVLTAPSTATGPVKVLVRSP